MEKRKPSRTRKENNHPKFLLKEKKCQTIHQTLGRPLLKQEMEAMMSFRCQRGGGEKVWISWYSGNHMAHEEAMHQNPLLSQPSTPIPSHPKRQKFTSKDEIRRLDRPTITLRTFPLTYFSNGGSHPSGLSSSYFIKNEIE